MDNMIIFNIKTKNFGMESGIYDIACLVVEDYVIVEELHIYQKIDNYEGEHINGDGYLDISNDRRQMRRFHDLLLRYNYPLVAHNCAFDRKFLIYNNWLTEGYPTYCSMRAIRSENKNLSSYTLDSLVSYYEVPAVARNTSVGDVLTLFMLLKKVRPKLWLLTDTKVYDPNKRKHPNVYPQKTQLLSGEVICFKGKSNYKRADMQKIAFVNGADVSVNITLETTLLVIGKGAGNKIDRALENGVSIIGESEYMEVFTE